MAVAVPISVGLTSLVFDSVSQEGFIAEMLQQALYALRHLHYASRLHCGWYAAASMSFETCKVAS